MEAWISNSLHRITKIDLAKFEVTKGIIRSRKWMKDRQYNDTKKKTKGQTIIYKELHKSSMPVRVES